MTDNSSIDLSVANIWQTYRDFRRGKKPSLQIREFEANLLNNIQDLAIDLQQNTYHHGPYIHMIVNDTKRRDIAVAGVRDRIVHRLLYNHLVPIFDKHFMYDAWSCRRGKGLHAALARAEYFTRKYNDYWVWRCDITKFFDSVDTGVLEDLISMKVQPGKVLELVTHVIDSYGSGGGVPIGNLTSQLFANIYLHELDLKMTHDNRVLAYMRYGDDWLCYAHNKVVLTELAADISFYLKDTLKLTINPRITSIQKVNVGFKFLGKYFR